MSAPSQSGNEHTTRTPAIRLENVTKQYGHGSVILDNISAVIQPGEFVSIIGPSGCGKSTLLKLVAGLSPITSGKIVMERLTLINARRITSFIFQDPTLLPWRTVHANVALGLELAGVARATRDKTVNSLLSLVGLSHVAQSFPRQLSGGMKMRVSIARALASDPRVLLLDEPFAALDEMTRDRMNEELLRLQQSSSRTQPQTILFVTHSVAEAVFLSTRILVLAPNPGRLAHDLQVDLPARRGPEVRRSEAFDRIVAEVSRLLRAVEQRAHPTPGELQ